MRRCSWQILLVNGFVLGGIMLGWTASAAAQRRPIADNTLGNERSRVVPFDPQFPVDRIEGGARRGDNLFHSFREFHVDEGRGVYFENPGVDNILARVTGGVASQILGVLGVEGNANLFLINPSGIIFGNNARLDVRGSFVATTANAVQFGEQGFFSATDPTAPPLLTIQPSAALFSQLNPAAIANNSRLPAAQNPSRSAEFGLRVPEGENLTLLGGNVSMNGGGLTALGGRIEVGGLSQPGTVTFNADGSLGFPTGVARSDVSLTNGSRLNAIDVTTNGGSIAVNARELEIANSSLSAGTGDDSRFVGVRSGDITLNASNIRAASTIIDNLVRGSSGNGGDVRITTGSLALTDNSIVQATLLGQGSTGSVIINAGDRVAIDNSLIFSNVGGADRSTVAVGNGGNIEITAPSLSLINGAQLQSVTFGRGNAGNVIINASDRISLNGSAIFSDVARTENTTGEGSGGDIRITTGSLSLTGAELSTATSGQGNAGNVSIDVRDRATLDDSGILSSVNPGAVGNGGNIEITTSLLSLTNGSQLVADTLGQGDAGNVSINARDRVSLDGASSEGFPTVISSTVGEGETDTIAEGNGGDIRITTGTLSLTNGASLDVSTLEQGNAGDVILNVRDRASFDNSSILSSIDPDAIGDGGNIQITTSSLELTNGAQLSASTRGQGDAGEVLINAGDRAAFDNSSILSNVNSGAVGNGGNIEITAPSLSLTNGAQLTASTDGQGNPGDVIVSVGDRATFDNSAILSNVDSGAVGEGGNIHISADSLSLTETRLSVDTSGQGNAGDVSINVRDRATLGRSSITSNVNPDTVAEGGDVRISAGSLSFTDNSNVQATLLGQGRAGNVMINARDRVFLDRSAILSTVGAPDRSTLAVGNGGNIEITTPSLTLTNGAQLATSTLGRGNAGNVSINARDRATFDNSSILSSVGSRNASTLAVGNGGNIEITTPSLTLTNGAQLATSTLGRGNAGNVSINARDRATFDNSSILSSVRSDAVGNGGNIRISAGSLFFTQAQLAAATGGQGRAGNVSISVRDRTRFDGGSILSNVDSGAVGNGGNIRITTGFLSLTGAQLIADTQGRGNAGNLIITARDRVSFDASSVFSNVGRPNAEIDADINSAGNGGNIEITTDSLSLTNGSQLQSITFGQGNAGNVTIRARDRVSLEGSGRQGSRIVQSGIFTTTTSGAQGRGGNVRIATDSVRLADGAAISTDTENNFSGGTVTVNANRFEAIDGGQVSTSTSGSGQAGSITLNAADRITIAGTSPFNISGNQGTNSGLFASTARNSAGRGGTVQLTTEQLRVFDRARIAVDSQGRGIAGNIDITASEVQLDNRARLTAETAAANGGNITLRDVELLQLGNNSLISTTAGSDRSGGNGGNIDIDADLIVALPNSNSDIRANAFTGNGGNVRITTEGLFGIAAQPQDNPRTSDITASSQQGVQGTIDITTPDTDPRRGLTELPVEVVDASNQMTQTCSGTRAGSGTSEFIVTGRGGLPTSPTDLLVGDESFADWSTLNESETDEAETAVAAQFLAPPSQETDTAAGTIRWRLREAVVEAQGWVVGEDGSVQLIAAAPASDVQTPAICQSLENR